MGGVPKQRHTKSKRDRRRLHLFLKAPALSACSKCGKLALSHTTCPGCGFYKGLEVIDVLKKLSRKERKKKEKEIAAKEKEGGKGAEKKPLSWERMSKK